MGVEVHRAGKFCLGIRFLIYTPLNGRNKMCLRIDVHENDVQTRKANHERQLECHYLFYELRAAQPHH